MKGLVWKNCWIFSPQPDCMSRPTGKTTHHKLIQDIITRWNSSFDVLERFGLFWNSSQLQRQLWSPRICERGAGWWVLSKWQPLWCVKKSSQLSLELKHLQPREDDSELQRLRGRWPMTSPHAAEAPSLPCHNSSNNLLIILCVRRGSSPAMSGQLNLIMHCNTAVL